MESSQYNSNENRISREQMKAQRKSAAAEAGQTLWIENNENVEIWEVQLVHHQECTSCTLEHQFICEYDGNGRTCVVLLRWAQAVRVCELVSWWELLASNWTSNKVDGRISFCQYANIKGYDIFYTHIYTISKCSLEYISKP